MTDQLLGEEDVERLDATNTIDDGSPAPDGGPPRPARAPW